MSYLDSCARCGESYDSDNLMTCKVCRSDVCYRCFGRLPGHCTKCSPDEGQPSVIDKPAASAPSDL